LARIRPARSGRPTPASRQPSPVRPELWAAVASGAIPDGLIGFNEPIVGSGGQQLPATQHDAVVWLTGGGYDVVFDASRGVLAALTAHAPIFNEIVGWPYHGTST
jgi:putative iron-dependent peroxidase